MATLYLSSTNDDLLACRKSTYDALCHLGHHVVAMEHYVAMHQPPLKKCLDDVARCDLYIGIFAWRYGYIPTDDNPEGKSITDLEYRHAIKTGKTCLLFLLREDAPWSPTWMDMMTGHGNKGTLIAEFREELKQQHMVSYFHDAQYLASAISQAVALWEREQAGQEPLCQPLSLREQYLRTVLRRYSKVKLPIVPQEGFSLHAIFQPLTLLRDPHAPEDLEQERRRSLLGEQRKETEDDPFAQTSRVNELHREEERGHQQQEGENITTRGVDLLGLPTRTRLHLGDTAIVEVTGLRNPCVQLDHFQAGLMAAVLGRDEHNALIRKAGIMAIILASGEIRPGDLITIELPPEPQRPLKPI